jgi:hypothetical protein
VLERHGGPFMAPQENLAIGVSETRTCPANLSGNKHGDQICQVRDIVAQELGYVGHVWAGGQTCPRNASGI